MEGLKSLFSLKIYNTFLNPDVVNFIEKNGYRFLGSASAFSNGKMIDCNQLRKGTHRYDFVGGGGYLQLKATQSTKSVVHNHYLQQSSLNTRYCIFQLLI